MTQSWTHLGGTSLRYGDEDIEVPQPQIVLLGVIQSSPFTLEPVLAIS